MRQLAIFTLLSLITPILFAQTPALRPGDVSATALQPFEAHYLQQVQGQDAGRRIHHLQEAVYPDGPGFRYVITMLGSDTVYDEVRFLAAGFEPVSRHVSARTLVQNIEVWNGSEIRGFKTDGSGASPKSIERGVDGVRFAGALELILSALKTTAESRSLAAFNSDFGLDKAEITLQVHELSREKLHLADRDWSTRVIESRILDLSGRPFLPTAMKLWIAPEPPYLIKMEMGAMVLGLTLLR